ANAAPGDITRMDLYDGAALIGTVSNGPPFIFTWTNLAIGLHTLTAQEVGLAGVRNSAPVQLQVFPDNVLAFVGPKLLEDGTVRLDMVGPPNLSLRLEAADSLGPTSQWVPILTNTSTSYFSTFTLTDPANFPQRFYRITPLQ